MNLQIFNTIRTAVSKVLTSYPNKVNPLDQEPKTEVSVLMERFEDQTKTNKSIANEN